MTDLQSMLMAEESTGPMKEGRFFPYIDTAGKMTIGYGRNLDADGISNDEALMFLNSDIADAIEDVQHTFSCYDSLSRPRQMVLVSLAFNLGRARLNTFVRFIGAVHLSQWHEAADELLNSKAAVQAPARYRQLALMMRMDHSPWA